MQTLSSQKIFFVIARVTRPPPFNASAAFGSLADSSLVPALIFKLLTSFIHVLSQPIKIADFCLARVSPSVS